MPESKNAWSAKALSLASIGGFLPPFFPLEFQPRRFRAPFSYRPAGREGRCSSLPAIEKGQGPATASALIILVLFGAHSPKFPPAG